MKRPVPTTKESLPTPALASLKPWITWLLRQEPQEQLRLRQEQPVLRSLPGEPNRPVQPEQLLVPEQPVPLQERALLLQVQQQERQPELLLACCNQPAAGRRKKVRAES
jgi:hypothetical protein